MAGPEKAKWIGFPPKVLRQDVKPDDDSWVFKAKIPRLPPNETDGTGEKIWLKVLAVTAESIRISFEKHSTNRILASDPNECFVLASFANFRFRDEPPRVTTDYISRLLKSGVIINGTKYMFYGHSNSQLSSRSCYLFAVSYHGNGEAVIMSKIQTFGDFSQINSIAKRAKRIGLLFSAASSSLELDARQTRDIDDVEINGHLFTDGCGMLSRQFAKELSRKSKIVYNNVRYVPSAFQIRYKGYKGMLMMNPSLTEKAHFRASMKKFKDCPSDLFSVVGFSKPFTYAYLNGELVTLLSSLGISDDVFIKKQQEYFAYLKKASVDPEVAFKYLYYKSKPMLAENVLLEGITPQLKTEISQLIKQEWAQSFKKSDVKKDNERVRILIEESRILFGVCDYTGTLKEGECHVRITCEVGGSRSLVGADVIVSRNPCLHPGDIRKFTVVEVNELDHLVDCIVFPIIGERDPASLMSGGDLDGDKFFVSWDKDIIPKTLYEPYGYPPAKATFRREITYSDMINYFARYNNASLGRVKNTYLNWVRVSGKEGAGSKECQELNKLFSACVDGEQIKIPEHLEKPPNPSDEMQKFILDRLCEEVQKIGLRLTEEDVNGLEFCSKDVVEALLGLSWKATQACLVDEFELFQLTLRWTRHNAFDIREFLCCFDFGAFTTAQKHAVLASLGDVDAALRAQYVGTVWNALYSSNLLEKRDLVLSSLDSLDLRWQLLYASYSDDGQRLYSRLEAGMEQFDKKLIIMHVDEGLTVAVYIPIKVQKGEILEVGEKKPVKLFAFDPISGNFYKRQTTQGYLLSYDGEIIQLYNKRRPDSFIWFALNEKWAKRNGLVQDSGFKVSIALQKFDERLRRAHSRVRKTPAFALELYVISNRDRVGQNILDISSSQVDTVEMKRILENIPREYTLSREATDWTNKEFCRRIIVEGRLNELNEIHDVTQLEELLYVCIDLSSTECMLQILDHQRLLGMLRVGMLYKCLETAPSLICLVVPALVDGRNDFVQDSSHFLFLLKYLLIASNKNKETSLVLFDILQGWLSNQQMSLSVADLVNLVKRIIFSVRHKYLAEEFISTVLSSSSSLLEKVAGPPPLVEYVRKFLLAIAMDYLGEIAESCPCDRRGIPSGAEDLEKTPEDSTSKQAYKNRPSPRNTYHLSEFIDASLGTLTPDAEPITSDTLIHLKPEQICLEIKKSQKTPGLYETILRIDIQSKIKNEDHIRFCASKRASDTPDQEITVFDAIVQNLTRGKLEFVILQAEPPELTSAMWNVYICGSTTNLTAQLCAIQTLVESGVEATVAFEDICELNNKSWEENGAQLEIEDLSEGFNESQSDAIRLAVNSPFTLIWGPPGTGKTTVVVEIIKQFLQLCPDLRLLVTASTHNAVDNVMVRFLKMRQENLGDSESRDTIRLTSDVSKVGNPHLKKWTLDAYVGKDLHSDDKAKREARKKLKGAKIVFSTCAGAGVGMLRDADIEESVLSIGAVDDKTKKGKTTEKFDMVIVDEASQITEPNALIPIVKMSKHVILVGDHVQLCPTVTELGKIYELEKSLFEKLYKSSSTKACKVMLDTQYRMHPDLARFPSNRFYEGKLKTGVKRENRLLPKSQFPWPQSSESGSQECFPNVFIDTPGMESNGTSKKNLEQVKVVLQVVELLRSGTDGTNFQPKIAVLTPYSKQKEITISELKRKQFASDIEVNTIDGFQGREADIIIFTTVRANHHCSLGFLEDLQRINVALTRARYGMIIIGHEETLNGGVIAKAMLSACKKVKL